MTDHRGSSALPSRRSFLGALGVGTVALAGCLSTDASDGSDEVAVRGDPDAEVTLEVYEDFLCDFCQSYNVETFPAIEEQYLEPGLIRYEHRDYPFLGDESWQAASALREVLTEYGNEECWAYKAELMAAGNRIESEAPDIFGSVAEEVGVDGETVQAAAVDRTHDDATEADRDRGQSLGVGGTPSFVVDGELMDDLNEAFQTIDESLQ